MHDLDVTTLLQVSALFHAVAALVWVALAQAFRMAPRAARLLAGAHGLLLVVQATTLPPPVSGLALLGSSSLLLVAVRRLMQRRQSLRDAGALGGMGAALLLAGVLANQPLVTGLAATVPAVLLAGLAGRDVWRGLGSRVSTAARGCAALPFVALMALGLADGAELLTGTPIGLNTPARVVAWFFATAGLGLCLFSLVIWRLITRIQHLTLRDPLTGALNRRTFEAALAEAQAGLGRGQGFALVMIDIDHFKRINDRYGHAAGDAALQHCVRVWQAHLREVDRLGRLGGEEFCVLLLLGRPGDITGAAAAAERLREQLATTPLPLADGPLPLSASFGVALPAADDPKGEIGLARADAQLYRAKADGRNCVRAADAPAAA